MANTDAAIVAGGLALVLAAGITVAVHGNPDTSASSGAPSPAPAAPTAPSAPAPSSPPVSVPVTLTPTTPPATSITPTVAVTAPTPSVPESLAAPLPSPQVTVTVTPAPTTSAYTSTVTIVYTVRPGDNLSVIADWFHTHGYSAIYAANRKVIGSNPALIHPGQQIKIVGGTPTAAP